MWSDHLGQLVYISNLLCLLSGNPPPLVLTKKRCRDFCETLRSSRKLREPAICVWSYAGKMAYPHPGPLVNCAKAFSMATRHLNNSELSKVAEQPDALTKSFQAEKSEK